MITAAAVKAIVNGEEHVFPVHRYGDFYLWMKYLHCDYDKLKVEQGFLDWNKAEQKTEFVSREEAFERARLAGQVEAWKPPQPLYTEDLW